MVIDTSAVAAILFDEPERHAFNLKIIAEQTRLISAVSFVEASIVIEGRKGPQGRNELDLWLSTADIDIIPAQFRTG